jgi:2'-5' RNA ligase
MRVFLALELPSAIKGYLSTVTKLTSQKVSGVKWVRPEGMHVTLKFFGEIEERKAQEIGEALQGINKQHTAIPMQIKELNAFPDLMRPRVIVVTFQEGVDNVRAIFHDIESRLLAAGIYNSEHGEREGKAGAPTTVGRDLMLVEGATPVKRGHAQAPEIEREKRGFTPHITIGRVKDAAPLLKKNILLLEEKRVLIDNLVLYQSTLTREGAFYIPLKEIKLERNLE